MKRIVFNLIMTAFVGLMVSWTGLAQEGDLVIVGNSESVPAEMDMGQLKSILRGEKLRWKDGAQVVIALMKTSTPIGSNTSRKLYDMTVNELNKYFLALVFQGKLKAPAFFNSSDELEAYVAQTPGAIGVLQKANDEVLRIIVVDGKTQI